MANHKSAEKRAKQSEQRRLRNRSYIASVKSQVKKFLQAAAEHKGGKLDLAQAELCLREAQAKLQKAASKGLIHKGNASRRISRLAHMLK